MTNSAQYIPVVLPDQPDGEGSTSGVGVPVLGHAGFILVNSLGQATWYEYGTWPLGSTPGIITTNTNGALGNIRSIPLGSVQFDSSGNITEASLQRALDQVFSTSGLYTYDPGMVEAVPYSITGTQYTNILSGVNSFISNVDTGSVAYHSLGLNCIQFVYDMAAQGLLTISSTQNSYGTSIPSIAGDSILLHAGTGYEYFSPHSVGVTNGQSTIQQVSNFDNLPAIEDYGRELETVLANFGQATLVNPGTWIDRQITSLSGGLTQYLYTSSNGDEITAVFGGSTSPISVTYSDSSSNPVAQIDYNANGSDIFNSYSSGALSSTLTDNANGTSQTEYYNPVSEVAAELQSYTQLNATGILADTSLDFTDGNQINFGEGAINSSISNPTSGTISTQVYGGDPVALGTLSVTIDSNTGAETGSFTLDNGLVINLSSIPADATLSEDPTATPEEALEADLAALGYTGNLEDDSYAYLNPTGTAHTVTPYSTVATNDNQAADVTYYPNGGPGRVIHASSTATIEVNGSNVSVPAYNTLIADSVNLSQDNIAGIEDLQLLDGGPVTLSNDEFNNFATITGTGFIDAADGGTYDLRALTDATTDVVSLTATGFTGTTLIGDDTDGQTLQASLFGNDSLTAGDGAGDTLIAGEGVDTIITGNGGDTVLAPYGLTAGSSVEGNATDTLQVDGDITPALISGIGTLDTTSITLTASQFEGFSSITAEHDDSVSDYETINAATGGTYDLGAVNGSDTFNMNALSNEGTTLIANGGDDTLTASATGNDTLQGGSGSDQLVAGGGIDRIIAGSGGGAIVADDGLAAGSVVEGNADYSLEAGGDISGATVSGISEFSIADGSDITMTGAQLHSFSDIEGDEGATISITTAGTYNLTDNFENSGTAFDLTALSNGGTTLEEDGTSSAPVSGIMLTASASGNDTLKSSYASDAYLDAEDTTGNVTLLTASGSGNTLDASGSTGTDTLNADSDSGDTIYAGDGTNTVYTGENANVYAGAGADAITDNSFAGGTTVYGGTGTATVTFDNYLGTDTLIGGSGNDTVILESGLTASNSLTGGSGTNTLVIGSTAADNITADSISGFETLETDGGTVTLTAAQLGSFTSLDNTGTTATTLDITTAGNINLASMNITGNFNITGGPGNDTITGSNQNGQQINAGTGTDTVVGGNGNNDILAASSGTDTLEAGTGTGDELVAGTGVDTLLGGSGNDTIIIEGNLSYVIGTQTITINDSPAAGTVINGEGGSNTLETIEPVNLSTYTISNIQTLEVAGSDTLTAAQFAGFSSISNTYGSAVTLDATNTGVYSLAGKNVTGNFNLSAAGSAATVTLTGNNQNGQTLTGGAGYDTLNAGNGNGDVLTAGSGATTLIAGTGTDTLIGGSGPDNFVVGETGNPAADTLVGGSGTNYFDLGYPLAAGTTITGGSGTNEIVDSSADYLDISHITVSNVQALQFTNVLLTSSELSQFTTLDDSANGYGNIYAATGGTYSLAGATDNDGYITLNATSNAGTTLIANNDSSESLYASASGADTLTAGTGNDSLYAGATGNDTLNGGGNYNNYEFGSTFGQDTVNNNGGTGAKGEIDFQSLSAENLWFQQSGNNLLIDLLGTSDQITVAGYFNGNAGNQVSVFNTDDGSATNSQIAQLVQAMATYGAGHSGFNPTTATSMPTDSTLQSAITAAWHAA